MSDADLLTQQNAIIDLQQNQITSLEGEVNHLSGRLHLAENVSEERTRVRVKKVKYIQGKLIEVDKQVNMLLQEGWDLGELHLQYGKFPIQVMNFLEEARI